MRIKPFTEFNPIFFLILNVALILSRTNCQILPLKKLRSKTNYSKMKILIRAVELYSFAKNQ